MSKIKFSHSITFSVSRFSCQIFTDNCPAHSNSVEDLVSQCEDRWKQTQIKHPGALPTKSGQDLTKTKLRNFTLLPSATKLRRLCFYTCVSVHGEGSASVMLGYHPPSPVAGTPGSRHPPGSGHPPGAGTPPSRHSPPRHSCCKYGSNLDKKTHRYPTGSACVLESCPS